MDLGRARQLPILDVARRLGIEINKGNKALCFNHNESVPSLSFQPKKNVFKCFGCGIKGDVITLVESYLKIDFPQALNWLDENFSIGGAPGRSPVIPRSHKDLPTEHPLNQNHSGKNQVSDPKVYEWIVENCTLTGQALNYLVEQRKFSPAVLEAFKVRSIIEPRQFFNSLFDKWGIATLYSAGLLKSDTARTAASAYKEFVWRTQVILFPFIDEHGGITYLQGRQIGDKKPKYLNLFGVEPTLYNRQALGIMVNGDKLFICEGVTDTMAATAFGLHAVGVLGAMGFKRKYSQFLLNYEVYVIPDNDAAGKLFAKDVAKKLLELGKIIGVLKVPKEKDLSEYLLKEVAG